MTKYIIRRLLISIPVLLGVTLIVFLLLQAVPGGPTASMANNPRMTAEQRQRIIEAWGLDKPVLVQYWNWLTAMLTGNWSYSLQSSRPVGDEIKERIPATLTLMIIAYVVQQLIAIPLGIFSALKRNSLFDKVFTILAYVGYSMPTFWFALIMIYFFAVQLGWFPTGGIGDYRTTPTYFSPAYWQFIAADPLHAFLDLGGHLVLPVTVLAIVGIAGDSRFMRSSMLETINQDYIRTARAKGLSESRVVRGHAIRPALLPVVTNIALTLPNLIGGAVVTETLFNWPGMGRRFIQGIEFIDYPILMGIIFLTAILIVIFNIVADVLYAVIDPRIRYS